MQLNKAMRAITLISVAAAIVGAYWVGLLHGKKESDFKLYDYLLSDLGNNLYVYDALQIQQADKALSVLSADIESDFNTVVELYVDRRFDDFEHLRCAITRRIRSLRTAGNVETDEKRLAEKGFDVKMLNHYLAENCIGKPSKTNWAVENNKRQEN